MLRHFHEKLTFSTSNRCLSQVCEIYHSPPSSPLTIQSCSSKFWAWSCNASNFDEGWREDHKHKIMDRPFKPKYDTVSQVLLQLVLAMPCNWCNRLMQDIHWLSSQSERAKNTIHCFSIQLFRERLSDKVYATTPKSIVGGFEFTVFKEIWKNGRRGRGHVSASAKGKQQKWVRQLQCQEQCIEHIPYYRSGLSRAHFFRQPFSK